MKITTNLRDITARYHTKEVGGTTNAITQISTGFIMADHTRLMLTEFAGTLLKDYSIL